MYRNHRLERSKMSRPTAAWTDCLFSSYLAYEPRKRRVSKLLDVTRFETGCFETAQHLILAIWHPPSNGTTHIIEDLNRLLSLIYAAQNHEKSRYSHHQFVRQQSLTSRVGRSFSK